MSVLPDPEEAPPYFVDTTVPHARPEDIPFHHVDSDGTTYTWRGMWDPTQPPGETTRRVVPDPDTRMARRPMAGISTPSSSSGTPGAWTSYTSSSSSSRYPDPEEVPDMADLTDPEKLRALADWFDRRDDSDDDSEVQDDLRAIARRLEDSVDPTIRVEQAVETIMDWLAQHDDDVLAEDGLDEAMEVLTGWLSER